MNQSESNAHDDTIRGYWQFARIVCFSILVPLGIGVAFAAVPQGVEILHSLVEAPYAARDSSAAPMLLFVIFSVLLAHFARYWASALMHFRYPAYPPELLPSPERTVSARIWIPKLCAALVHLGIAVGFLRAGLSSPGTGKGWLFAMAAVYTALAALMVLTASIKSRRRVKTRVTSEYWTFSLSLKSGESRMHTVMRVYAFSMLLVAVALVVAFAYGPDGIGRGLGAPALMCIAGCAWLTIGSFLRLLALRYRLPLISAALVAALVFSLWMDNHSVHTVKGALPDYRLSLREQFRAWHERVQKQYPLPARTPRPVFIVAAEGGGIRAAFWTAKVLCTLQDLSLTPHSDGSRPVEFAPHVFALSGVSGGSLGSAVFTAMCADGMAGSTALAENMLSRDHLSPLMAKMFFPDTIQRFLPLSWSAADRARGLERSWEVAWREQVNKTNNRFAEPFHKLWSARPADAPPLPNLFLNATVVETGQRLIASNVPIRNDAGAGFLDALDAASFLDPGEDFSLGSAVHLSARFTYFSPAGRISSDRRIVDGGYFENSGTVTAMEILRIVRDEIARLREQKPPPETLIPVLILISNEPGIPDVALQVEAARISRGLAAAGLPLLGFSVSQSPALMTTAEMFKAMPASFASELLAPVHALLRTRESRGSLAKVAAFHEFNPLSSACDYPPFPAPGDLRSRFVHFRLNRSTVLLPLGWSLSGPSCDEMNRQLWQWSKSAGEKWSADNPGARPSDFNAARLAGVMQMLGNTEAAAIPFSPCNRNLVP